MVNQRSHLAASALVLTKRASKDALWIALQSSGGGLHIELTPTRAFVGDQPDDCAVIE